MGIAIHEHNSVYGVLPMGGAGSGVTRLMHGAVPATYSTQTWGWTYQILPYLEQNNLYFNPTDAVVYGTPIKTYNCPSLRGGTVHKRSSNVRLLRKRRDR